jgi:TolB protein
MVITLLYVACSSENEKPVSYKIAYNVWEDTATDNYEIYVMDMDGSNRKNISNHPGLEWVYYAYKDKIFFISDRDTCARCYFLYEMDADGNNVRKISDLQLEDSWMSSRKDGAELVVTGRIGKDILGQIFILNTKDGSYKQITNDTVARYNDPLFLPDERQIVLRYKSDKRNRDMKTELFLMNDDGTGLKQLTTYPASDSTAPWFAYHAGPPRWNTKEQFITYQSLQDSGYHLFKVTMDGKGQDRLTKNEMNEGWHDWSPDGKWLAIERFDREQKIFDIYLMNWESKEIIRLTDSWKFEQAPVFVEVKK